ncbi:hypothetical protein QQF64_003587 [Cirrhinus molitorella]|uniref:IF rod domain-containing protein n=1 Tax=Cirrhinus molitorella TaxID=172907 RepID=A0ABR3MLQ7_9TELE
MMTSLCMLYSGSSWQQGVKLAQNTKTLPTHTPCLPIPKSAGAALDLYLYKRSELGSKVPSSSGEHQENSFLISSPYPSTMSCSVRTSTCLGPKTIVTPIRCGTPVPCAPKAYSVYGCGFGGSTRISSSSYRRVGCYPDLLCKIGGGYGGYSKLNCIKTMPGNCDYIQLNEKCTMQNLNDRLASYMDKVRSLEAANANLERQIREYYENKGPICQRDYSHYWNTINCLKEKIEAAAINNANILLQIDNSKLAADDFRIKYEHELAVRKSVEADIANLRRLFDQLTLTKADLEAQIETLQDDLACLKRNHQEDVAALLCQLTDTKVCVEVDAAPQQDLNKVLDEIRCHYENIIDKHRREQECWFKEKTAQLCKDVASNSECLETSRSEISDLRRTLQCLEIDLQSQLSMKRALECSLSETEARYSNMLAGFQKHINALEAELCQVRTGIEQQGRDYAALLDIKSRLEQEIATYRCLLDKQDIQRDPTTDRHGGFDLLRLRPGPVHPTLDDLVFPSSPRSTISIPSLVQTPDRHSPPQPRTPELKRSASLSLPVAWITGAIPHGGFDLLRLRPGPVHPSLDDLVVPSSPRNTISIPNLVRTPDRHSPLQPRTPELKRSASLSLPVAWITGVRHCTRQELRVSALLLNLASNKRFLTF